MQLRFRPNIDTATPVSRCLCTILFHFSRAYPDSPPLKLLCLLLKMKKLIQRTNAKRSSSKPSLSAGGSVLLTIDGMSWSRSSWVYITLYIPTVLAFNFIQDPGVTLGIEICRIRHYKKTNPVKYNQQGKNISQIESTWADFLPSTSLWITWSSFPFIVNERGMSHSEESATNRGYNYF